MKRKIILLLTLLTLLMVVFVLVSCGDAADASSESAEANNAGETTEKETFAGVGTYIKIIGKDNKLLHTYLLGSDGVAVYGVRYYELGEDYLKSLTDKFTETNT